VTDAELTMADGIVRAAKDHGAKAYTLDIDFLLGVLAELRRHRGIERKAKS
jgi:hypothetical protein